MFLGDRRELVEHFIVAETDEEHDAALAALLPQQREDFIGIFEAMDGLPVTVRLIDPPLHEFLPDLTDLSVLVAHEDDAGNPDTRHHKLLGAVKRLHEQNPMLGLRGVRLGIAMPGLFTMQARAILEAAAARLEAGGDPRPEIMVPLVATAEEFELVRAEIEKVAAEVIEAAGRDIPYSVGTMIELPRAVLTADRIARTAEFFSFGTNDLTQMTWGFSRDDVESSFFSAYLEKGIFAASPFETLDRDGVGRPGPVCRGQGPPGASRPAPGGVRGARRRPGVHPLLRGCRAGLRVVLALPGAGGSARGGPRRSRVRRRPDDGRDHMTGAPPAG